MTEPKHTPGPWKANFDDYTKPYIEITNEDNVVVAQIPDGEVIRGDKTILGLENIESNTHLIAAAPDMYEALEGVCSECPDKAVYECKVCPVGQALRKARGETE